MLAPLFSTVKLGLSKVPAARALQEITAGSRDVAYLRGGGVSGGVCERTVAAAYGPVGVQLGERDERPDA